MASFNFETDVVEASRTQPVLVDFWAEWCGPCRVLGPVLEKLAAAPNAGFKLVKIDTERHQDIAARFRISSIPAVKLFVDGKIAGEFVGALPESEIRRWLSTYLPSESRELVSRAKEGVGRGEDVAPLLEKAIALDPEAHEARVMLAAQIFASAPTKALALLGSIPATDPASDRAQVIVELAELITRAEQGVPDDADAKTMQRWQAYFDGALAVKKGHYAQAIETWIDLVKLDRKLDDDGARRATVALFTMLGDNHPLTQQWRRPFSLALY